MKDIRVLFFGTPIFACSVLETLINEGYNVVAVCSQADKPVGRKQIIEKTPTHVLADKYNIPVVQPIKLRNEVESVLAYEPDLIVTCAYGQIIPESILNYPKYGCLNVHPSLLPKYRGGAPVHRAVMNGDKETGVCLMEMVKAMDAGRVYACEKVAIGEDMTTAELNLELEKVSKEMIKEYLPKYLNGELEGVVQDEDEVVFAPNIAKEEEQVFFKHEDINTIYNHIRGLIDWPIAYGLLEGKRVKFYKARKTVCDHEYALGTILNIANDTMNIACLGGILHIYELQYEGKNKMDAKSFYNGLGKNLVGKIFD